MIDKKEDGNVPLIRCIECGNEVSSYANSCPKCGCPVQKSVETELIGSNLYDVQVNQIHSNDIDWIRGFICKLWGVNYDIACATVNQIPFTIANGVLIQTANEIKEILEKEGCTISIVDSKESKEVFTIDQVKATGGESVRQVRVFLEAVNSKSPDRKAGAKFTIYFPKQGESILLLIRFRLFL